MVLDCLRAVGVLLILLGHVQFRLPENTFARPVIFSIRQLGLAGVDLFYVLSGFCIGRLLLAEHEVTGTIGVRRFFARRALRLWPSYFLVVLFAWQWSHWVGIPDPHGHRAPAAALTDMWPYVLHIQNYFDVIEYKGGATAAALQTWTLVSIIHFYVIAALLLAGLGMMGRRGMRLIPWITGAVAIACYVFRYRAAPIDENHYYCYLNYFPTHLRLDEPMFGLLLAYLTVYHPRGVDRFLSCSWPGILVVSSVLLLPIALRKEEFPPFILVWGYTTGALASGGFVLTLWWMEQRRRADPEARPMPGMIRLLIRGLALIGLWSYSIYLWHEPLTLFLQAKIHSRVSHFVPWTSRFNYPATALAYFGVAIAIGGVMYYALELPSLILRRKLVPSRLSKNPVVSATPV